MPYGIFSPALSGVTKANPWWLRHRALLGCLSKWLYLQANLTWVHLQQLYCTFNPPLLLGLMFKISDRTKDCCCRNYYKHANIVTSVKASVKFYMIINDLNFVSASEELLRSSALLTFLLHTLQFLWLFACFLFLGLWVHSHLHVLHAVNVWVKFWFYWIKRLCTMNELWCKGKNLTEM